MLKPDSLKKGLIIWWTRKNSGDPLDLNDAWDCPCIITRVSRRKNTFSIFSFDDFEESHGLTIRKVRGGSPSSLKEMRPSSLGELIDYLVKGKIEIG